MVNFEVLKLRLYLDTNVLCRPFDDQTQARIREESEAFVRILEMVERHTATLISSDLLLLEVEIIRDLRKRERARCYLELCSEHVSTHEEIRGLAEKLERLCGLVGRDAYHVSSACYSNAEYFLTCDDRMLKRKKCAEYLASKEGFKITMLNPIEFVEQVLRREDKHERDLGAV
ncbi:MAG: type II toxin-antitoxin system VapC family toxin [Candidatus Bathyarchaeia archaeon]